MNNIPIDVTPPPRRRIWGGWATAGLGMVVLIVFFMFLFLVIFMALIALILSQHAAFTADDLMQIYNSRMGLLVSISGIVAYAAGTMVIISFIKMKGGASLAEYLGLKRPGWKIPLIMTGVTAAYLVAVSLVTGFFHVGEGDTTTLVDLYDTAVLPALLWIAVVILAPVFEEAMFRGFLFEGFRRSRIGVGGAILITTAVWTVLHAGYSPYSLGAVFIFGLVLGFVRYRTGSLWNTMLMHAFYNAVGLAMIALNIGV